MTISPHVRRAAGLLLLAVTLATACTFLGRWQWNRHVSRDAQIRLVQQNYDSDPVPLATLLPSTGTALDEDDVWRQVTVTGHYDTDATVLLRNRPVNSEPGFHVLVPLVLDDASAAGAGGASVVLVVDRGWVSWDEDASGEVAVPDPPTGEVTVTVRLRQDEDASDRDAPTGQVQAINVAQVLAAGGLTSTVVSYDAYGALVEESPAAATALGELPAPSTDPGSHLSYAFQWWVFALGSLIGFSWMARREVRDGRALVAAAAARAEVTSTGGAPPSADGSPGPPRGPGASPGAASAQPASAGSAPGGAALEGAAPEGAASAGSAPDGASPDGPVSAGDGSDGPVPRGSRPTAVPRPSRGRRRNRPTDEETEDALIDAQLP